MTITRQGFWNPPLPPSIKAFQEVLESAHYCRFLEDEEANPAVAESNPFDCFPHSQCARRVIFNGFVPAESVPLACSVANPSNPASPRGGRFPSGALPRPKIGTAGLGERIFFQPFRRRPIPRGQNPGPLCRAGRRTDGARRSRWCGRARRSARRSVRWLRRKSSRSCNAAG